MAQPALAVIGSDGEVEWAWSYTQLGTEDDPWTRVIPKPLVDEIAKSQKRGGKIEASFSAPVEDFHNRTEGNGVTFSSDILVENLIDIAAFPHQKARCKL